MNAPRRLLALLTALALALSGCGLLGGDEELLVEVELERSFNLFAGSPVTVRGVDVGVVRELRTSPDSGVVTAEVLLDGTVEVPSDATAVVVTSALLGERYLQFEGGESDVMMAAGDVVPVERTMVPFEFDEVLEGLNRFVGGLEEDEVARLVGNLADVLEGNGEQLGSTIDAAGGAIASLESNDDELLALAGRVADLASTLQTRDTELQALLADFRTVARTLTDETTDVDGALDGLVVLTTQLADLLSDHRVTVQQDLDTLTRVGRTIDRNLDQVSIGVLGGAELFRHAERVIDRDDNLLPLVNHTGPLVPLIEESLVNRLVGLCIGAGLTPEQCGGLPMEQAMANGVCVPPLVPCNPESGMASLADVLTAIVRAEPAMGRALLEERGLVDESEDDAPADEPTPDATEPPADDADDADDDADDDGQDGDDEDGGGIGDLFDGLFGAGDAR